MVVEGEAGVAPIVVAFLLLSRWSAVKLELLRRNWEGRGGQGDQGEGGEQVLCGEGRLKWSLFIGREVTVGCCGGRRWRGRLEW